MAINGKRVAVAALAVGLLVGLTLLASKVIFEVSRSRCFVLTGEVACRIETRAPVVALTFDDGPTAMGVEAILPELERHDVRATFFLTGQDSARRPELVRAIVAAGHEVGNHSYTHQRMVFRSGAFYADEVAQTQAALARAGGHATTFRPPYGKKLIGLPLAVERAGLRMIMWNIEDPITSDPDAFARGIVEAAEPGSIILVHAMHRGNGVARAALPAMLSGLQAKGLTIVPVSELLAQAE